MREAQLQCDGLAQRLSVVESGFNGVLTRVLQLEEALQKEQADHVATKREYLDARQKLVNASDGWVCAIPSLYRIVPYGLQSAAVHDVGSCEVCGAPAVGTLVPCGHNVCEGHKMHACVCDLPFGTPGRCMVHGVEARCPYPSCQIEIEHCGRYANLAIDLLSARHVAMRAAERYCREKAGYAKALASEVREQEPAYQYILGSTENECNVEQVLGST